VIFFDVGEKKDLQFIGPLNFKGIVVYLHNAFFIEIDMNNG
jgi:hypothetical protein